jgi:hypothetical protein
MLKASHSKCIPGTACASHKLEEIYLAKDLGKYRRNSYKN